MTSLQLRLFSVVLGILILGCTSPTLDAPPSERPDRSNSPSASIAQPSNRGQELPISAQVEIFDQTIQLEVARTASQQALGLMYRDSLPENQGMLFPFNPPRPVRFWMQNVKISLDMVFLRDSEVKAIAANVPPCTSNPCPTYGPNTLIDQVIELRGGRAEELGLQVGDVLRVEFLDSE
jgi:uncharacterized membrane protein (UPF0127 family)